MKAIKSTTIGEQLHLVRIRSGLSQDDLAMKVGVTQQTIAKWECGASAPRARRMVALAAALNLPDDTQALGNPLLHELLLAELIINTLQNVLTDEQRQLISMQLAVAGLQGSTRTRSAERRAAITAAGENYLQPRPA